MWDSHICCSSTLSRIVETSLILSKNQSKLQNRNSISESFYPVDVIFTTFEYMALEHFRIFMQLFCVFLPVLLFTFSGADLSDTLMDRMVKTELVLLGFSFVILLNHTNIFFPKCM